MKVIRKTVRKVALDVLSLKAQLSGQLEGFSSIPAVQFVLLHHIVPSEEAPFAEFLKWLAQNYEVVSYSEAVDLVLSGDVDRATAAISFDDGLKNNLTAARILEEHGMHGCFFVCPDVVGEREPAKIERFCEDRLLYSNVDEFMNWDELRQLKDAGHEIGNHSQSHLYMMELSEDQFLEQVCTAKVAIGSELGEVKHFAWPYGRFFHFRKDLVGKVVEAGHVSCASGERGAHAADGAGEDEPFCLLRDSLEMNWPIRHNQYFLSKSTRNALRRDNIWQVANK